MATYNFYCSSCKDNVVVRQSIHTDLPTTCPVCGSGDFKQQFPDIKTKTLTGVAIMERCEDVANQDIKKLLKGNDKALLDLVGDKKR